MHPIRKIKQFSARRRQVVLEVADTEKLDREVDEFIAEVDKRVDVYELDPSLPEVLQLKREARELLAGPMGEMNARLFLHDLNPYRDVSWRTSHLTIHERWFGHVFQSWTLVEYHLKPYEVEAISRIRVDGTGTRAFASDWREQELVHYQAGVLNPGRMADPGNRVRCAAGFIEHFTGIDLDWRNIHKFHWLEVTKQADGTWVVEYDPEPAYT